MVKIEPRDRVFLVINSSPREVDFHYSALITCAMNAVADALAVFRNLAGMMLIFSAVPHSNIRLLTFNVPIPGKPVIRGLDFFNFTCDPNMGLINCNLGRYSSGPADRRGVCFITQVA